MLQILVRNKINKMLLIIKLKYFFQSQLIKILLKNTGKCINHIL